MASRDELASVVVSRSVMAGLVPAIHVFAASTKEDVDARDKPGHDDSFARRLIRSPRRPAAAMIPSW
jgi:hypothetical protein